MEALARQIPGAVEGYRGARKFATAEVPSWTESGAREVANILPTLFIPGAPLEELAVSGARSGLERVAARLPTRQVTEELPKFIGRSASGGDYARVGGTRFGTGSTPIFTPGRAIEEVGPKAGQAKEVPKYPTKVAKREAQKAHGAEVEKFMRGIPTKFKGTETFTRDLPRTTGADLERTTLGGRRAVARARKAGSLADLAVKGAAGGALGEPDDPGRGIATGAIGGLAPTGIRKAMQSWLGRAVGRWALPEAALYALHGMGMPFGASLALVGYHWSPLGRNLRRSGEWVMDNAGKVIGWAPPGASGYIATKSPVTGAGIPSDLTWIAQQFQMGGPDRGQTQGTPGQSDADKERQLKY